MTTPTPAPEPMQPLEPLWSDERSRRRWREIWREMTAHRTQTSDHLIGPSYDKVIGEIISEYEADRATQAATIAELRQEVTELAGMLERRQRCEECNGSGAVSFWHHDEDGGYDSLEPCECWSDAEDLIAKHEKAKATND